MAPKPLLGALRYSINVLTRPVPIPRPLSPSLRARVDGRVVFITGASSGIGRRLAQRVSAAGATTVITARRAEELADVVGSIEAAGGVAHAVVGDLSSPDGIDGVAQAVLDRHGAPDIFVSNAGRSIMRSVAASQDRLHDYERTMRLNYLAAVGLTLRLLPEMRRRGSGHIVHSSSVGVLSNLPTFSAYIASKAALEAFFRVAAVESLNDDIEFTNVHLPLVKTDMIAPTDWGGFTALTVDEGADMLVDAIRRRPRSVNNPLGSMYLAGAAIAPGTLYRLQNAMFVGTGLSKR
ncbi:SDR family NAD(P)-dependent oxidoreductase [Mycolicibacterium diernhoferi]|uniref:Oxidoreductase n=2 Tax=Mycolicibacterium diernhoferi TaxID=1801 RepID=A0A1Q4HDT2_9MYCO|nr:SDR family NAD(P)-dependent oxidoreductase [Mycolicibacterium diernhoferi]OJZ65673.1 oxidoreductase [Mycolicibacterium diernhoferi]PEG56045.1 oxidoreductase [Mycolicibacterium diernhoferi]QYL22414.1 SDR family NAD(P)-dependent oxidoreductase [Mycolicibacterium diernhoferi]